VLVDEYQDTNRLQASVLLALKPNGRGLTVVGDDAQSIYSFRAATVRIFSTSLVSSVPLRKSSRLIRIIVPRSRS
jgi:ATP-dependent exoDNAse (exonuclease V) beta subunit